MLNNNLSLTPSAASFFWGLNLSKHISVRIPFLFYPSFPWSSFMWFETITMATRCIMHEFYLAMPGVTLKLSLLVVFYCSSQLWSVKDGSLLKICSREGKDGMDSLHGGWVTDLHFSRDNSLLVSTGGYIKVRQTAVVCRSDVKILILGKIIIMIQLLTSTKFCIIRSWWKCHILPL